MYAPNRQRIFEDIEPSDKCDYAGCSMYRAKETGHHEPLCMASCHSDCMRVEEYAHTVNQFIALNDDMFIYIKPIGE
jgi:hypothetical protein